MDSMSNKIRCNLCNHNEPQQVFYWENVPLTANVPLESNKSYHNNTGQLDIVKCGYCSHVYNRSFDPVRVLEIYSKNYSSGIVNTKKVIDKYNHIICNAISRKTIQNKIVCEIGASDFLFSDLMLSNGADCVIAFEPSDLFRTNTTSIIHINDYFSAQKMPVEFPNVDVVVARHVFEHMCSPIPVLIDILNVIKPNGMIYIELPDCDTIIKNSRFQDFCYEHVSYFTIHLLTDLLDYFGFSVEKITTLANGMHFGILAKLIKHKKNIPKSLFIRKGSQRNVINQQSMQNHTKRTLQKIRNIIKDSKSTAFYGAGSHGVYTAVFCGLTSSDIVCFFDINEFKEGKYTPGTLIKIEKPTIDRLKKIDTIIITADLHQEEIYRMLKYNFFYTGKIVGTYPTVTLLK